MPAPFSKNAAVPSKASVVGEGHHSACRALVTVENGDFIDRADPEVNYPRDASGGKV